MIIALLLVVGVLGGGALLAMGGLHKLKDALSSSSAPDYPGPGQGDVLIEVKSGQTAADVAKTLVAKDVVKSSQAFIEAAYANPDASKLQPGFYQLQHKMPAADALAVVLDPSARVQARVTLPEGLRLDETLKRLAKETKLPLADYEKAIKKRAGELGLPGVRQGQPGGLPLPGHLRRAAERDRRRRPQAAVHGLRDRRREGRRGAHQADARGDRHHRQPGGGRGAQRRGLRQGRPGRLQPARAGDAAAVRLDGQLRAQGGQADRDLRGPRRRTRRTTPTSTPACRRRRSTRPGWRR